ncbi:MAG: hypothetical protein SCH70_02280 [Candidatus Methanoperedens sp.]|nr:hypothetical protein [Candidatus Methanoperedens sp.]
MNENHFGSCFLKHPLIAINYDGEDNKIVAIEMLDASENISEPQVFLYEIKKQIAARKAIA